MALDTPTPQIKAMLPRWKRIRDFVAGPEVVKAAREEYLPRLPGQKVVGIGDGRTIDTYTNYLLRAVVLPFAAPLLSRLVGLLFRKAPVFAVPPSMGDQLANLSLSAPAATAEQFAKAVSREVIQSGFAAIAVDYDPVMGRSFQRLYAAGSVLGVDHRLVGATAVPSRVRLSEQATEPDPKDPWTERPVAEVRVLELAQPISPAHADAVAADPGRYSAGVLTQTRYRRALDKEGNRTGEWEQYGPAVAPERLGAPLWFIPIVPVTSSDIAWTLSPPPLEVLIDLVWHYYLVSADWRQLLHASAGALLFGAGWTETEAKQLTSWGGLQSAFCENQEATVELKQVNGESSEQLVDCLNELKQNMALAIGRLFMAQQKGVAESGAALELQFSGDDANLQQIGSTVAMGLEAALRIHAWWNGSGMAPDDLTDVSVDLGDSFVARRLSPQELQSLTLALDSGNFTDLDRFWNLKQAEALAPKTDFETWQAGRSESGAQGGVELADLRATLAALKAASASGDASRIAAAVQALDVLVGELPADEGMGGAA